VTKRYYTDQKEDQDQSELWAEFHEQDRMTRRLFKLASQVVEQVLGGTIGPTEAAGIINAYELREESVLVGMLVADSFVMMGERQLSLDILKALHTRAVFHKKGKVY